MTKKSTKPDTEMPAAGPATEADVVHEAYDNEAEEGVACTLTLRDGRTLVGACARSDDLTLAATQQAAYFAALGAQ